jgi:hypothetical protein
MEKIPEFVTPPISFGYREQSPTKFSCFIATRERNFQKSSKRIQEITKYLREINFYIEKNQL